MYKKHLAAILLLTTVATVHADIPWNGPGPRPPRPTPFEVRGDFRQQVAPLPTRLTIVRDTNAENGTLVVPPKLIAALKPVESPRIAARFPVAMIGLALVGSLIAGAMWLGNLPHSKYLVGVMLPLLGMILVGAAVQAQPAKVETSRGVIETCKVRLSRDAGETNVRLMLPKRVGIK